MSGTAVGFGVTSTISTSLTSVSFPRLLVLWLHSRHFRPFLVGEGDSCDPGTELCGPGGHENFVGLLEDVVVRGGVEGHCRDVGPHSYRKLKTPQTIDGFGAAAPIELFWFVTDVADQDLTKLTRKSDQDSL